MALSAASANASLLTNDPALGKVIKNVVIPSKTFDFEFSHKNLLQLGEMIDLKSNHRVTINSCVYKLTDVIALRTEVVRFYVSGSYGRRVSIGTPIVDIVVFINHNGRFPPYTKHEADLLPKLHRDLMVDFPNGSGVAVLPLISDGCTLPKSPNSSFCKKKKLDKNHRCCKEYITALIGEYVFRIFIAPSLGQTSEDQRQATYQKMQAIYSAAKDESVLWDWTPALIERASEAMAQSKPYVQAFIRVCKYWVLINEINSFEPYAVETLAFQVANNLKDGKIKKPYNKIKTMNITKRRRGAISETSESDTDDTHFDLAKGFECFLGYCSDLRMAYSLCEMESPAAFVSPFTNLRSDEPILVDNFNPYCNLLASITNEDLQRLAYCATFTSRLLEEEPTAVTLLQIFTPPPLSRKSFKHYRGRNNPCKRIINFTAFLFVLLLLIFAVYVGVKLQSDVPEDIYKFAKDIPTNLLFDVKLKYNQVEVFTMEVLKDLTDRWKDMTS